MTSLYSTDLPSPVPVVPSPDLPFSPKDDLVGVLRQIRRATGASAVNRGKQPRGTRDRITVTPHSTRAHCDLEAMQAALLTSPPASISKDSDEENTCCDSRSGRASGALAGPVASKPSVAAVTTSGLEDTGSSNAARGIEKQFQTMSVNQYSRRAAVGGAGSLQTTAFPPASSAFPAPGAALGASAFAAAANGRAFGVMASKLGASRADVSETASFASIPAESGSSSSFPSASTRGDGSSGSVPIANSAHTRSTSDFGGLSDASSARATPELRAGSALSDACRTGSGAASELDTDGDVDPDPVADAAARAEAEINETDGGDSGMMRTPLSKRGRRFEEEDTSHSRLQPRPPKVNDSTAKHSRRRAVKTTASAGTGAATSGTATASAATTSTTGSMDSKPAAPEPATSAAKTSQALVHTVVRDGVHRVSVSNTVFEIDTRYCVTKPVGHGSYGVVVSADDTTASKKVAIKKIANLFCDFDSALRMLREVKLITRMRHTNILCATDLQMPASFVDFKDLYIFTELMETDMHRVIYSRQRLSEEHIKYFMYQLICSLRYLHSANVIHRDIKPSNILLNADCKLRLCDFGFARGDSLRDETMTEYVVTRWYRAPEVMLSSQHYSSAVDIWSAGCVFAELLGAKAIFPGEDYVEQLRLITGVLGSPTDDDLSFVSSDLAKNFMRKLPHREKVPFAVKYPSASAEAIDLLERMLCFNPNRRISAEEALHHPFLASFKGRGDESLATRPFSFEFEKQATSMTALKTLFLKEIARYHPEMLAPSDKK